MVTKQVLSPCRANYPKTLHLKTTNIVSQFWRVRNLRAAHLGHCDSGSLRKQQSGPRQGCRPRRVTAAEESASLGVGKPSSFAMWISSYASESLDDLAASFFQSNDQKARETISNRARASQSSISEVASHPCGGLSLIEQIKLATRVPLSGLEGYCSWLTLTWNKYLMDIVPTHFTSDESTSFSKFQFNHLHTRDFF